MLFPLVSAGMKQIGYLIGLRINTRQVRSFMQIAIDAGQGKIAGVVRTSMLFGNDVLDMQDSQRRVVLMEPAILATIRCTLPDECLS